ncbi:MAG: CBS domain-containing protein [Polynucleobacter sp.]|jgi:CBS domain-containing protein|nr:CBS domain-containing protein [Polynucleobacter sp.]
MSTVEQFLDLNSRKIWSLKPENRVIDSLFLMAEKNISCILIMNQEHLAGIFSERDYARKVVIKGKNSTETLLKEVMTDKLITISPKTGLDECMQLMTDHRIRHLPIVDNNKVVGLISIGDVVREMLVQQKVQIDELQRYISG